MNTDQHYDFIVVGGGSAGCVAAARLADANVGRVLLLEAGDPAEQNPDTLDADRFVQAYANENTMIDRLSARLAHCKGRRVYVGTGTGMGGSGAVNGMVYTRGDKRDFEQWPAGWKWADVVPVFEQLEATLRVRTRPASDFTTQCLEAALQAGFERKDELNDGDLCGYFGYQLMNYEANRRRNSYVSFLQERAHPNLTVLTRTRLRRIVFDDRKTACAVEIQSATGVTRVGIGRELILCAGALETPRLLMLSGIGPAPDLQKVGVDVVADVPALGQNLQDHPNACVFYRGNPGPDIFYPQMYGFDRMNKNLPLADRQADTCFVFFCSSASLRETTKRMLPAMALGPGLYRKAWPHKLFRGLIDFVFRFGFTQRFTSKIYGIVVILGKPLSRGQVKLVSSDPEEPAHVDTGYLQNDADADTLVEGILRAQDIAAREPLARWGNRPLSPIARTRDKTAIKRWLPGAVNTTFHFSGTCTMGERPEDPVDTRLRLRAAGNIRIADASVVPEVPVAALNAPSMMIGWRVADFIVEDQAP